MITWSRKRTLIAGVGLILIANAVALIGAGYNRSAPPESVLRLTQREVHPSYRSWSKDNSGIALNVQWRLPTRSRTDPDEPMVGYGPYGGSATWLDQASCASSASTSRNRSTVSEDVASMPASCPKRCSSFSSWMGLPIRAALRTVREYAARQEALRAADPGKKEPESRARRGRDLLQQEEETNSRLFVVDAGLDAAALRAKYPDRSRYAIVHGFVRPNLAWDDQNSTVTGFVSVLNIDEINVPNRFRPLFTDGRDQYDAPLPSRYEVTIAFGKRLEPWIAEVSAQHGK